MNKTVKSFVKSFIAVIKGDDVTAQAEKAFRQASSALNTQISSLGGDTVTFEDAVLDAKEKQQVARINGGQPISNRNTYVQNLLNAKNEVTKAEEAHETHLAKIKFLKDELAELEKDVEQEATA